MARAYLDLAGERNAPGMPLPWSAVERYAARHRQGLPFVEAVMHFDRRRLDAKSEPEKIIDRPDVLAGRAR